MSSITPRFLIDSARSRHWSFSASAAAGDGAALLYLQTEFRTKLAQYGSYIEGLLGATIEYAVPLPQPTMLVTEDATVNTTSWYTPFTTTNPPGYPAVSDPYEDGWPISVDDGGHLYFDPSQPAIAGDPFALNGGVPGFPLPPDMIRLTYVVAVRNDPPYASEPVFVVPEPQRLNWPFRDKIGVFTQHNRLVPIRDPAFPASSACDEWSRVGKIQISYVPVQQFQGLDDVVNFPAVLAGPVIAQLADYFAMQSKECPPADKKGFAEKAEIAFQSLENPTANMLYQTQSQGIRFRGRGSGYRR